LTSPSTSAVNDPVQLYGLYGLYRRKTLRSAQGFTGRATCSPANAGAAKAGIDQAYPGRRHDISINSISAAPIGPFPTAGTDQASLGRRHDISIAWHHDASFAIISHSRSADRFRIVGPLAAQKQKAGVASHNILAPWCRRHQRIGHRAVVRRVRAGGRDHRPPQFQRDADPGL
jgi:hypothetical protein